MLHPRLAKGLGGIYFEEEFLELFSNPKSVKSVGFCLITLLKRTGKLKFHMPVSVAWYHILYYATNCSKCEPKHYHLVLYEYYF